MSHTSSSDNTADLLSCFRDQQAKHDENCVEDEVLESLHEAWPHISGYITDLNEERITLEKELFQEKAYNCQLHDDMDDLKERIQELENQLSSLQISNTISERSMILTSPTDYNPAVGSAHLLASPAKVIYSRKRSHKLD
ncbi:hypothetical protein M422DRAFT_262724 [Sphaerobolus stellatus SS14]|uniref:Uncharacterized protein n=1 Tax=Sphaerobolus stellatus (strain SS14) TaxID=990650 RepID=A0A0C9V086_SPHS4|nr:hypothetical protein M422DRAFT_262724 [Sphaerobolus stellatus SS14]